MAGLGENCLGVAGILYGAVLALKRLVAYTSVSHMGFVLLAVFAGTATERLVLCPGTDPRRGAHQHGRPLLRLLQLAGGPA